MRSSCVVFVCSAAALLCQICSAGIAFGRCPDVNAAPVTDEVEFDGVWYEIRRADSFQEPAERCNFIQNRLFSDEDGNKVHVNNTGYNGKRYISSDSVGIQVNPERREYNFDPKQFSPLLRNHHQGNFFMLYAEPKMLLSYSCQSAGPMRGEIAALLHRERFPEISAQTVEKMNHVLADNGIHMKLKEKTPQIGCPATEVTASTENGRRNLLLQKYYEMIGY